jgi:hypothetical protein
MANRRLCVFLTNVRRMCYSFSIMKIVRFASALCVAMLFVSCAGLDLAGLSGVLQNKEEKEQEPFSNAEAIQALKDALAEGTKSACNVLAANDGFFGDAAVKILLPPEAKSIIDNVSAIPGGQGLIDDVVLRLNRSAEKASQDAASIFLSAIQDMTIADGIAIARGSDTAATEYLKDKTYDKLIILFKPHISTALDQPLAANISANKAWQTLTGAYNKAGLIPNRAARLISRPEPMPEVKTDLAQYAAEKAIDAVFLKVSLEEKKIRAHPLDYASALIKKVFGALLK